MIRKALLIKSVLLFMLTVALWVRSYWVEDHVAYRHRRVARVVLCFRGAVYYGKLVWPDSAVYAPGVNYGFGPSNTVQVESRFAFRLGRPKVDWYFSPPAPPGTVLFTFAPRWRVKYGFLAVLFGIFPFWALVRRMSVRLVRRRRGLCLACGYDLTANESGVCPECGRKVEAVRDR